MFSQPDHFPQGLQTTININMAIRLIKWHPAINEATTIIKVWNTPPNRHIRTESGIKRARVDTTTQWLHVMRSCHGNAFRITGLLWRETTSGKWISLTKVSNVELWYFRLLLARSFWTNNRVVGDLRRYGIHVTSLQWRLIKLNRYSWSKLADKINRVKSR